MKLLQIAFLSISISNCSTTMSNSTKRLLTTGASALTCGLLVQTLATKRNKTDVAGSTYASASLCGAGALVASESFFSDQEKIKKLEEKLDVYRKFETNRLETAKTLPHHVVSGIESKVFKRKNLSQQPFCQKQTLLLCPMNGKPNLFDNCSKPAMLYLSPNWAIEYRAWYSDSACWQNKAMAPIPGLKEYLNKTFIQTYMDLERKQK